MSSYQKYKYNWSYYETHNLILEIKKRKVIWDRTSEEYKDKSLRHGAWIDVCMAVRQEYDGACDGRKKQILSELQNRWKRIKDANKRSQKKRKFDSGACDTKKYVFADLLTFLQKTSTDKETDDSLETNSQYESLTQETNSQYESLTQETNSQYESLTQDTQGDEEQEEEPISIIISRTSSPESVCSSVQQTNTRKRRRKMNIEERMIAYMDRCDNLDADKDFFSSLLPFVRTLTEDQNLEFKSQVITHLQRIKSRGYVAPPNPLHKQRMMGPSMTHSNYWPMVTPDTSHRQNSTSLLWNHDQQGNRDCDTMLSRPGSSTSPHGNNSKLSNEQLWHVSKQSTSTSDLISTVKFIIPPLAPGLHKGQAGRVAVIGGCQEYTGAPYFSAITALKVGADLSHVFCTAGAATVIKSYSPELIVHPILDNQNAVNEICQWLPRFHSLVIGPGLGRDPAILDTVSKVITKAKEQKLPIVIDADGLFLVTSNPTIIKDYDNVILTPNVAEFSRLFEKVTGNAYDNKEPVQHLKSLCSSLGHVTIVQKGEKDMISDGHEVLVCSEEGSPRRCGGQGDLLSGSMGLFLFWAKRKMNQEQSSPYSPSLIAAFAACTLTRACSRKAFAEHGRTMTASDLLPQIQHSFEDLFS